MAPSPLDPARAPPSPASRRPRGRRPALAALLGALAAVAAAGCVVEPDATSCATGIYCPAGARCAARQAVCIVTDCGDGAIQPTEKCDDGNVVSGDGCSGDCLSNETCGNGIEDTAAGEVCDVLLAGPEHCSPDCRSTLACGNGKFDPGEDCDPGVVPTDICNVDCTVSRHGDGIVNALDLVAGTTPQHGELCDGGLPGGDSPSCQSAAGCAASCCTAECTPSAHGDGIANPAHLVEGTGHGEECDDGARYPAPPTSCESAGCDLDCTFATCGDGTPNPLHTAEGTSHLEECDDGNRLDDDDCLSDCRNAFCGDGFQQLAGSRVEGCDLGPRNSDATDCAYGPRSCAGCSTACVPTTPTPHFCGDGQIDAGRPGQAQPEQCDSSFSFTCRKCDAVTCQTIPDAAATGRITVPGGSQLADGDALVFSDGLGGVVTVRFRKVTGSPAAPSCPSTTECLVEFRDGSGANGIADDLAAVVGLWTIGIGLDPSSSGSVVVVRNGGGAGIAGNVPIQRSPSSTKLVVEGMQNGVGCPLDRSYDCAIDADCVGGAAGSCDVDDKCVTPPPPP